MQSLLLDIAPGNLEITRALFLVLGNFISNLLGLRTGKKGPQGGLE